MEGDFPRKFTAWSFLGAALMLWGGWVLLPRHLGSFFEVADFAAVRGQWWLWVWMFRLHIFGMIATVVALAGLGALAAETQARVLVWPAAAVASAGMIVGAVGAAFYYHHGAWGAREMDGRSAQEVQAFVDSLRLHTEYVTCLVRFGRVFSGLGLLILGFGLLRWKLLPSWVAWPAVLLGLAAMAVTMLWPDRMSLYQPVFHLKAAWLAAAGLAILRSGVRLPDKSDV
jgi:hypothetical protein